MSLWSSKLHRSSKSCKRNLINRCILPLANVSDLPEYFSLQLLWFSSSGPWKVSWPNFLELKCIHARIRICMLMSMWQSGMPESQGGYLKTFFLRIPEITCTSRTPGFSKEIRYFKSFFFWCVGEICRGTFPQGEYINQQRTGRILLHGLCPKPLGSRSVLSMHHCFLGNTSALATPVTRAQNWSHSL